MWGLFRSGVYTSHVPSPVAISASVSIYISQCIKNFCMAEQRKAHRDVEILNIYIWNHWPDFTVCAKGEIRSVVSDIDIQYLNKSIWHWSEEPMLLTPPRLTGLIARLLIVGRSWRPASGVVWSTSYPLFSFWWCRTRTRDLMDLCHILNNHSLFCFPFYVTVGS